MSTIIEARTIDLAEPVPPIDWVVPDFAARGYLTILAGAAGVGKTTLALQMAAQVGTPESPALYLDSENGPVQLRRLTEAMAIPSGHVALVDMNGLALTDGAVLDTLRAELLGRGVAALARRGQMGTPLIVFDSLRRFAPGLSENSSDDMAPYIASLTTLARDTQSALVLIHHASSKPDAPAMRGSTAVEDQTDIAFTLGPYKDTLKLQAVKFRPAAQPLPAYYVRESNPLRLAPVDRPVSQTQRDALAQEVVTALRDGPLTLSDVARAVGREPSDRTVRRALDMLESDGTVSKTPDKLYVVR